MSLLIILIAVISVSGVDIRAACRIGHAPFSSWDSKNSQCSGISYQLFYRIMEITNLTFSIEPWATSSVSAVAINKTTNTSLFDIAISYTPIDAELLPVVDYCLPFMDTVYVIVLAAKFHSPGKTLAHIMSSTGTLYITALIALGQVMLASVYFIFESLHRSSTVRSFPHYYQRMVYCMHQAIAYTWDPTDLKSQVSRWTRIINLRVMMYIVTLFGSVVCASFTKISMSVDEVKITSHTLRGAHIITKDTVLRAYLPRFGIMTLDSPNLEVDSEKWLKGTLPAEGFATTILEAEFAVTRFGGRNADVFFSDTFMPTGLPVSMTFAMSKGVPKRLSLKINQAITRLRGNGDISEILALSFPRAPPDAPTSSAGLHRQQERDKWMKEDQELAVWVVVVVANCLYFAVVAVVGVYGFVRGTTLPPPTPTPSFATVVVYAGDDDDTVMGTYDVHSLDAVAKIKDMCYAWKNRRGRPSIRSIY